MRDEALRRRAPDGTIYQRVAKRQATAHEPLQFTTADDVIVNRACFHWCNAESPELLTRATPAHVCDIWEVSEDQTEPETPVPGDSIPTTDELIGRVLFTEEQLSSEPVPLLVRVAVLALLKQAKALEDIVVLLEDWKRHRSKPRGIRVHITRPPAEPSPDEQR